MRTSLKARLGALAATAALATSGVMAASGVADAAVHQAVKRLPTTLTIHASAPVTRHHLTFARISGLLRYVRVLGCLDPDDVASETWLQVVGDLPRFSGSEADFRGWVFTIGRHRAVDAARSRGARPLR